MSRADVAEAEQNLVASNARGRWRRRFLPDALAHRVGSNDHYARACDGEGRKPDAN